MTGWALAFCETPIPTSPTCSSTARSALAAGSLPSSLPLRVQLATPRLPAEVTRNGVTVQKRSTDILLVVAVMLALIASHPRIALVTLAYSYTVGAIVYALRRPDPRPRTYR